MEKIIGGLKKLLNSFVAGPTPENINTIHLSLTTFLRPPLFQTSSFKHYLQGLLPVWLAQFLDVQKKLLRRY